MVPTPAPPRLTPDAPGCIDRRIDSRWSCRRVALAGAWKPLATTERHPRLIRPTVALAGARPVAGYDRLCPLGTSTWPPWPALSPAHGDGDGATEADRDAGGGARGRRAGRDHRTPLP